MTGLGRSTVARRLPLIEKAGWLKKTAPSKHSAWLNKEKNSYTIFVPVSTSPTAGLVPERDQSTSPTAGPGLVPQGDRTSPTVGHEVPDPRTYTNQQPSSSAKPRKAKKTEQPREDVDHICKHLANWIVKNGSKRPNITQKWRTEARLLIDRDGRTVEQVIKAIDWCQEDEFWKGNILSMPTLREKYDQLRLAAMRPGRIASNDQGRRNGGFGTKNQPYRNPADQDEYDEWTKART